MTSRKNNKVTSGIFIAIVFLFLFYVLPVVGDYSDTHYTMNGTIIKTNLDEIIIEDTTGNLWGFNGNKYQVGDNVRITFYTNHTDNKRQDDEVIKVKVIENS